MLLSNTSVTVTVDGRKLGIFAFKSGGQTEADDTKFRPGSMQPEISLGGPVSVENVTVRKLWDAELRGLTNWLRTRVGKGGMTVIVQPLDQDGVPQGPSETYTGVLIRCTPPEADANVNDAAQLELEMSSNGSVA